MPIYEYQCPECSETMEVLQKFDSEEIIECPICDNQVMDRIVSKCSFTFVGGSPTGSKGHD